MAKKKAGVEMFTDLGELDYVFQQLDESCKYPDGLEWVCGVDSLLIKRVNQIAQAVEDVERKHGVRAGTSYQSKILAILWAELRGCDSPAKLTARLGDLRLLLFKAMIIAIELKSDSLKLLAATGEAFRKGRKVNSGSAIRKAIARELANHPTLKPRNLWEMLAKKHPKGWDFDGEGRERRIWITGRKPMGYARFSEVCKEEKDKLAP